MMLTRPYAARAEHERTDLRACDVGKCANYL